MESKEPGYWYARYTMLGDLEEIACGTEENDRAVFSVHRLDTGKKRYKLRPYSRYPECLEFTPDPHVLEDEFLTRKELLNRAPGLIVLVDRFSQGGLITKKQKKFLEHLAKKHPEIAERYDCLSPTAEWSKTQAADRIKKIRAAIDNQKYEALVQEIEGLKVRVEVLEKIVLKPKEDAE